MLCLLLLIPDFSIIFQYFSIKLTNCQHFFLKKESFHVHFAASHFQFINIKYQDFEIFIIMKIRQYRQRFELFLCSVFIVTVLSLFIRILGNFQTFLWLKHYSITFNYTIFGIQFESYSGIRWTIQKIILVYSTAPLIHFFLGLFILRLLKVRVIKHWKHRLIFTWAAFLLVNQLPFSMLAGTFIFDDFGYAYFTIINSIPVRVTFAITAVIVAVVFRKDWLYYFISSSPNKNLVDDHDQKKLYIRAVFILPFAIATAVISSLAVFLKFWGWLALFLSMILLVAPLFSEKIPERNPRFTKADTVFETNNYLPAMYLVVILMTFVLSFVKIHF